MFFIGVSIFFVGTLLIIFLGLSNTRGSFTSQLHTKRKKRHSLNINPNNPQHSYMTIELSPFSNLDGSQYIPNVTTIPLEDDEELMKCDILSSFCDNNSIELRLKQDLDSDNDADDESDN